MFLITKFCGEIWTTTELFNLSIWRNRSINRLKVTTVFRFPFKQNFTIVILNKYEVLLLTICGHNAITLTSSTKPSWKVFQYGIFSGPCSVRMRENTGQKKLRIWTLFTQWKQSLTHVHNEINWLQVLKRCTVSSCCLQYEHKEIALSLNWKSF